MRKSLASIDGSEWDVAVIGAGINGAGAARELARSGYSVLLCDKADFAAGASSRSSRMLHCGLRYFEAEKPVRAFGLNPRRFRQALTMARAGMDARHEIATTAPQAVKPFTMCFPVYPDSPVRTWHLDVGLRLLKRIGPSEPPLEPRKITSDFEKQLPFARDLRDLDRLQSIATYREYVFDWPDRFCVDAALEAEAFGAAVLNFCEARLAGRDEAGRWRIGLEASDGSSACVRARIVFNMAGTWIDTVNRSASEGRDAARRLVRGTKGAHIMVRLPEAYRGYGIATMHRKGMPFYCLPSHEDFFYFGPTETPFDGDATDVSTSDEEIAFLLGEANHLLPGLGLTRSDIAMTWAGVRPLAFDAKLPGGRPLPRDPRLVGRRTAWRLRADGRSGDVVSQRGAVDARTGRTAARQAEDGADGGSAGLGDVEGHRASLRTGAVDERPPRRFATRRQRGTRRRSEGYSLHPDWSGLAPPSDAKRGRGRRRGGRRSSRLVAGSVGRTGRPVPRLPEYRVSSRTADRPSATPTPNGDMQP